MNLRATSWGGAIAFAALLSSPVIASEPASAAFNEALQTDAAEYAKGYNVSEAEGLRRLKWQAAAGDVIERLRDQYQGRLAGLYVEHTPIERIVVRLKDADPVARRSVKTGEETVDVEFLPGAAHTQAELHDAIEANLPALKSIFPTLQGTYTDARTGEVVLNIQASDAAVSGAQKQAAAIAKQFGVPIRVHAMPVPLKRQAVTGGGTLGMGCTTAFVVKRTTGTTTGVTTAAHCGTGSTTFSGIDGATASLTYQAAFSTSSNDEQWYTTNATNAPKFYASSTTTPRTLTGRRTQASTAVGNNICHRGATTGYSCGDVHATDYQPTSYMCGPSSAPVACAATWIAMVPPSSGTGLACAGGDSGGPWFVSTVAAGIHAAGASSGSSIGQCLLAIYQSTDRLSSLGLQLLYGP